MMHYNASMKSILLFTKKEIVLTISFILALLSAFFVRPDAQYLSYIDTRTLGILLGLMITMAGFRKLGVFRYVGEKLTARMHSVRGVVFVLLGLCFFSSMLITNDVALITFVPFAIVTLSLIDRQDLMVIVIVLETVAANLGSMLTPLGNPQNLYLYSLSSMTFGDFVFLMLPYCLLSLFLLILSVFFFIKPAPITQAAASSSLRIAEKKRSLVLYLFFFLLSVLTVCNLLDVRLSLVIILILTLIVDRRILLQPDYALLLTFIFLFIFIGNMKRIPFIHDLLSSVIVTRFRPAGIL